MHSIRKFVGRGILAFSISALVVLAVAVQTGQAARLGSASTPASLAPQLHTTMQLHVTLQSTLSPQCSAAVSALQAAVSKDIAEDVTERANNSDDTESGADLTEDTNEKAALKPLFDAVVAQCGTSIGAHRTHSAPTPKTPACAAAWSALKAAFTQDRAEDQSELAAGTEGTAADQAEDQAEVAHIKALWTSVMSACGSGTQTSTFSFDIWHHR